MCVCLKKRARVAGAFSNDEILPLSERRGEEKRGGLSYGGLIKTPPVGCGLQGVLIWSPADLAGCRPCPPRVLPALKLQLLFSSPHQRGGLPTDTLTDRNALIILPSHDPLVDLKDTK